MKRIGELLPQSQTDSHGGGDKKEFVPELLITDMRTGDIPKITRKRTQPTEN